MIFRMLVEQYAVRDAETKAIDRRFMQMALQLGRRSLGLTAPNPAVGAVLVKDGVIVGRGWTQPGGRPHAEVEALRHAGDLVRGATLYVTLEPCSHQGRSPPCADAIILAGVSRVVSAMEDPNPLVAGQGHARLRGAGIAVDIGLCGHEAMRDHAGHVSVMRRQLPHVVLKLAVSADGKIGTAQRGPIAITGETTRAQVHLMRARSDAILVGIGTVLADDPELTCRLPGMAARSPARVVLDAHLRVPLSSKLVQGARTTPLLIVCAETASPPAAALLEAAGAHVLRVADIADVNAIARLLAGRGITRLMVEGGSRVAASFVKAGLVDEAVIIRGPDAIGVDGVSALDGLTLDALAESRDYAVAETARWGDDQMTRYERA